MVTSFSCKYETFNYAKLQTPKHYKQKHFPGEHELAECPIDDPF